MSCIYKYKGKDYTKDEFYSLVSSSNFVQQEQVKKFAELQERLNNKEFLEGAKNAFESSKGLQEWGTQEQYNDYIARVSLGIIKNPSSGEYNYYSKVKDIVYRGGNLGTKQPQDVEAFTTSKSYAEYRAEQNNTQVYPAVLNIKDSKLVNKKETRTLSLDRDELQYEDYGFTDNKDQTKQLGNFYTVKENNRHILGSKQDIEGFKKFVEQPINKEIKPNEVNFDNLGQDSTNKTRKNDLENVIDSIFTQELPTTFDKYWLGKNRQTQLENFKSVNQNNLKANQKKTVNDLIKYLTELQVINQPTEIKPKIDSSKKISAKGKMTFSYGGNKRSGVTSTTTFEAIKNGERTATTRYESDGHIDYWKNLKEGDIIEWESANGEKVLVEVTKPLHKLVGSGKTAEQWSKLEGWSVDYFNSKVKPKLDGAWQIEYKTLTQEQPITEETSFEDIIEKDYDFKYFGTTYEIVTTNGIATDVPSLKQSASETNTKFQERKQKILAAYNENKDVDKQNGRKFRNLTINEEFHTVEKAPIVEKSESEKKSFTYKGRTIETAFELTDGQSNALKSLIDFSSNSSTTKAITLQGPAGTGKTATIGYLQKYLGGDSKLIYLAPTHAATAELAFATVKTGNKSLPLTAASGFRKSINKVTGEEEALMTKKLLDRLSYGNNILVIDEVSMLNSKDYALILETIKNKPNIKLIFMGDILQIPEVNTNNPNKKQVSRAFTEYAQVILSEVKRTSSNSILQILTNLRKYTNGLIPKVKNTEQVQYVDDNGFDQLIVETFKKDSENTVLISYTNAGVKATNHKIREVLGRTGDLKKDDIITGYLGYSSKQIEKGNIANSIRFKVEEVEKNGSEYIITTSSEKLESLRKQGVSGVPTKFSGTYLQLSPTDAFTFDELTDDDFEENNKKLSVMMAELHTTKQAALKNPRMWSTYYDLQTSIGAYFAKVNLGDDYIYNPKTDRMEKYDFNKHSKIDADLQIDKGIDYGHAVTIHKSQGATFKNVFFDTATLPKGNASKLYRGDDLISSEKHALIYVAMSRASDLLVVRASDSSLFYDVLERKNMPEATPQKELKPDIEETLEDFLPLNNKFSKNTSELTKNVLSLFETEDTIENYKNRCK